MKLGSNKLAILAVLPSYSGSEGCSDELNSSLSGFLPLYRRLISDLYTVQLATLDIHRLRSQLTNLNESKPNVAELDNLLQSCVQLDKIRIENYGALIYLNDWRATFDLATDRCNANLLAEIMIHKKLIVTLGFGASALLSTRCSCTGYPLVKGRALTAPSNDEIRAMGLRERLPFSLESRFKKLGAHYIKNESFKPHCVIDGNLITCQNSQSIDQAVKMTSEWLHSHTTC